jgi:hypothetical protein
MLLVRGGSIKADAGGRHFSNKPMKCQARSRSAVSKKVLTGLEPKTLH